MHTLLHITHTTTHTTNAIAASRADASLSNQRLSNTPKEQDDLSEVTIGADPYLSPKLRRTPNKEFLPNGASPDNLNWANLLADVLADENVERSDVEPRLLDCLQQERGLQQICLLDNLVGRLFITIIFVFDPRKCLA